MVLRCTYVLRLRKKNNCAGVQTKAATGDESGRQDPDELCVATWDAVYPLREYDPGRPVHIRTGSG